jgi:hypothetical protein
VRFPRAGQGVAPAGPGQPGADLASPELDAPALLRGSECERSLQLFLKHLTFVAQQELGVFATDFIPRFARFGPLCGESRTPSVDEATVMPASGAIPGERRTSAAVAESAPGAAGQQQEKDIAAVSRANQQQPSRIWKVLACRWAP